MKQVFATIKKVAATDANVLILGKNGTCLIPTIIIYLSSFHKNPSKEKGSKKYFATLLNSLAANK